MKKIYQNTFLSFFFIISVFCRIKMFEGQNYYFLALVFFSLFILLNIGELHFESANVIASLISILVIISTLIFSQDKISSCLNIILFWVSFIVGTMLFNNKKSLFFNFRLIRDFIVIAAIYGIYEFTIKFNEFAFEYTMKSGTPDRYLWQFSKSNYRVASLFLHPIIFGMVLLIAFWFTFYSKEGKLKKYILEFVIVLNIFFTMSRSIWIAFIVGLILITINYIFYKNRDFLGFSIKISHLITLLILILILPVGVTLLLSNGGNIIDQFTNRLNNIGNDNSYIQRSGTLNYFVQMFFSITEIPFLLIGHGQGSADSFMKHIDIITSGFTTTDNQYISILYNYGVWMIFAIIYSCYKCIEFLRFSKNIDSFMVIIFVSFLVSMFFFEAFNFITLNWLFFVVWGYLARMLEKNDKLEKEDHNFEEKIVNQ